MSAAAILSTAFLLGCSQQPLMFSHPIAPMTPGRFGINLRDCRGSEAVVGFANLAYAMIANEAHRQRMVTTKALLTDKMRPISVCVLDQPEPCCNYGVCAAPCATDRAGIHRCARKAGCANDRHVTTSRVWPPQCYVEWPDEPHCIDGIPPQDYRWCDTLVHELANVFHLRYIGMPDYRSEFYAETGPSMAARNLMRQLYPKCPS